MSHHKYDYIFKITLLGKYGAGKLSLIVRYIDNNFYQKTQLIRGIDFRIIIKDIDKKHIKLQIWDPEPCCRRGEKIPYCYEIKGAHGLIFIYDISDLESFTYIKELINKYKNIDKKMLNKVCKILVGNKCDKKDRHVSEEDGRNFADQNNMVFFETSSKDDINVHEIFEFMSKQILDNVNQEETYIKGLLLYKNIKKEKPCCK